ncbi:MAG: hypothetical protein RIT17_329, partial [Pseudomonadota bacterium]
MTAIPMSAKNVRHVALTLCLIQALGSMPASAQSGPERNPAVSAEIYGTTHINSAQQNSIPYDIPLREQQVDLDRL